MPHINISIQITNIHQIYKYVKYDKYKFIYNINSKDNQVGGLGRFGCDEFGSLGNYTKHLMMHALILSISLQCPPLSCVPLSLIK